MEGIPGSRSGTLTNHEMARPVPLPQPEAPTNGGLKRFGINARRNGVRNRFGKNVFHVVGTDAAAIAEVVVRPTMRFVQVNNQTRWTYRPFIASAPISSCRIYVALAQASGTLKAQEDVLQRTIRPR